MQGVPDCILKCRFYVDPNSLKLLGPISYHITLTQKWNDACKSGITHAINKSMDITGLSLLCRLTL